MSADGSLEAFNQEEYDAIEIPEGIKMTTRWPKEAVKALLYYRQKLGMSFSSCMNLLNEDPRVPRNNYSREALIAKADRLGLEHRSADNKTTIGKIKGKKRALKRAHRLSDSSRLDILDKTEELERPFYGVTFFPQETITVNGTDIIKDGIMLYDERGKIVPEYLGLFKHLRSEVDAFYKTVLYKTDKPSSGVEQRKHPSYFLYNLGLILDSELCATAAQQCPLGTFAVLQDYVPKLQEGLNKYEGLEGLLQGSTLGILGNILLDEDLSLKMYHQVK